MRRSTLQVLLRDIIYAYLFVMLVVSPVYMKDGYNGLGDAKYLIFRWATALFAAAAGTVYVLMAVPVRGENREKKEIGLPDILMLVYLAVTLVSYLFSWDREGELLGENGWHMGLVTQLLMTAVYFAMSGADPETYTDSRPGKISGIIAAVSLTAVFAVGILNRFSVYPFSTGSTDHTFISTLGNIDWYGGFWSATAPVLIGVFWTGKDKSPVWKTCFGFSVFVCFLTVITQGSEGVLLSVAVILLLILLLSADEEYLMRRAVWIIWLFTASAAAVRLITLAAPESLNYHGTFVDHLAYGDTGLVVFAAATVFTAAVTCMKRLHMRQLRAVRPYAAAAAGASGVITVILFILNSVGSGLYPFDGIEGFRFSSSWGNSRGAIWQAACMAFASLDPLRKLIGVGPDGFAGLIYSNSETAQYIYGVFGDVRLTNAHNVMLTLLTDYGIIGTAACTGVFAVLIARAVKLRTEKPILYISVIMLCSYVSCNVTGFGNTMNAPYAFMMLGVTACICGRMNRTNEKNTV